VETVPTFSSVAYVCLPLGDKYRAQGSMCPLPVFCNCPFFPSPSSTALCRRRHLSPRRHRELISTLMAGKSQVLLVDAWVHSSVTERKMEELVHDGLL
jgi:hypothetical protein